jgi:hypothetical protein
MHNVLCRQAKRVDPRVALLCQECSSKLMASDALEVAEGAASSEILGSRHEGLKVLSDRGLHLMGEGDRAHDHLLPHGTAQLQLKLSPGFVGLLSGRLATMSQIGYCALIEIQNRLLQRGKSNRALQAGAESAKTLRGFRSND